jgi:solute carrier family 25 carnitine/acylcarnitine transporter 20/29
MMREIPGNMAWFGVYRFLCEVRKVFGPVTDGYWTATNACPFSFCRTMQYMAPTDGTAAADIAGWQTALAGGVAGMAFWTANFPADTVKSRQQTDSSVRHLGFSQIYRQIYQRGGFRALYKVRRRSKGDLRCRGAVRRSVQY